MIRGHLSTTITRMDAGVEPPWMVSRRVVGGCARIMSLTVNGTAVIKGISFNFLTDKILQ